MSNAKIFKTILFLAGLTIGLVIYQATHKPTPESSNSMNHTMHMTHQTVEVVGKKPTIIAEAFKDVKDGYNVHIQTTGYAWTPEKVNGENIQGTGHAHIYVNGVKVARVYGEWFHVPGSFFKAGDNTILVTLNANDHSEWIQAGQHIQAEIIVKQ